MHELEEIYTMAALAKVRAGENIQYVQGLQNRGSSRRASGSQAACCRLEVRSCSEEVVSNVVYIQAAAG